MRRERVADICRWVLGSIFTFSGIVKCVDPVGTSVFVEKYLATYSLEALLPAALIIAIALAVVEFTLGEMLLSGRAHRSTAIVTLIFTLVFTVITLLSATILPIGDCGCFGDAVRLTPMQTLVKNLVLLPMAVLLCLEAKAERLNLLSLATAVVLSLGLNLYSLRYSPIIDFMPYGEGVNLREAVESERAKADAESDVSLVFRRVTTGEEVLFATTDASCWEDASLEYVGTRERKATPPEPLHFAELAIYDAEGNDATLELLAKESVTLLTVYDIKALERHLEHALRVVGEGATVLTSADATVVGEMLSTKCYTIDAMTLRTMIRPRVGVIKLSQGTILSKSDVRD